MNRFLRGDIIMFAFLELPNGHFSADCDGEQNSKGGSRVLIADDL